MRGMRIYLKNMQFIYMYIQSRHRMSINLVVNSVQFGKENESKTKTTTGKECRPTRVYELHVCVLQL